MSEVGEFTFNWRKRRVNKGTQILRIINLKVTILNKNAQPIIGTIKKIDWILNNTPKKTINIVIHKSLGFICSVKLQSGFKDFSLITSKHLKKNIHNSGIKIDSFMNDPIIKNVS